MKVLVDAGLLEREQRGKWAYYRVLPGTIDTLSRLVSTIARPS
jgi:ArsR family transcriptional regulator